jgi:hypothetical protein
MHRSVRLAPILLPLALLLACGDAARKPAEAALQAAESAVSSLDEAASKLVPDQVQAVKDALAAAKEQVAKKDFKGALAAAGGIPEKVKEVLAAVEAKKQGLAQKQEELKKALTARWEQASGELPQLAAAVKSRLDILSQARKLPQGIDKAALGEVKTGLAALESGLAEARQKATGGDLDAAIARAGELKAKGMELLGKLGMNK